MGLERQSAVRRGQVAAGTGYGIQDKEQSPRCACGFPFSCCTRVLSEDVINDLSCSDNAPGETGYSQHPLVFAHFGPFISNCTGKIGLMMAL